MYRRVVPPTLTNLRLIPRTIVAGATREHPLGKRLVGIGVLLTMILRLALTSAQTAPAQITVGGPIARNTTWWSEVLVTDHVTVEPGVTLTILPGTRVMFQHYRGYREPERRLSLQVQGSLIAIGTAAQPIYFTSDAADPQNGDGEAAG